jgi:hypothetical protein
VCQLPVSGLSSGLVAGKMVTLGKSAATAPVVNSQAGQLSAEEWVTASEFVPGQQWKGMSEYEFYLLCLFCNLLML